jgi:1-acyl-sn-glycerol-3-phosphate acyltransferase
LLATNRSVIAFPEGAQSAAKSYRDRYRLQDFAPAAAIGLARECGVPLIPVGIVGAEEVQPVMWKFEGPARRLGLPFLPVTPTFPLLGLLGLAPLPSKWVIRIGAPIAMADRPIQAGEQRASDENEGVRAAVDQLVQTALRARDSAWR